MCVSSMIGDHYRDKWGQQPWFPGIQIFPQSQPPLTGVFTPISRQEFDDLRRDVGEMKELLRRAKIYDEKNNEPACEMEEKMDLLRRVAKLVGVEIDDVLKRAPTP